MNTLIKIIRDLLMSIIQRIDNGDCNINEDEATELNPIFKEKQDTEKRFNKIESDVSEMKTMLTSFIREFKQ